MQSDETYLGGINSPEIIVGRFPGNGIHVTSERLILVRTRFPIGGSLLGMMGGGFARSEKFGKVSGPGAARRLQQVEKGKYFEALKDNILALELKIPGRDRWSQLRIVTKTGEPMDVGISSTRDYEFTRGLLNSFLPDLLKLV